jgi:hypothetical protein
MGLDASKKAYAESTFADDVATGSRVGRKMEFPDKCIAALPPQTFARIKAASKPGEDRTDFIRAAVEAELKRREK